VVELAPDEPWNWPLLVAASLSALLTTNVASGNSEIALAWSTWRWVMTTRPTLAGSIPRARSWAGAACSRSVRRSLKAKSVSRPKFSFGLTATDGWPGVDEDRPDARVLDEEGRDRHLEPLAPRDAVAERSAPRHAPLLAEVAGPRADEAAGDERMESNRGAGATAGKRQLGRPGFGCGRSHQPARSFQKSIHVRAWRIPASSARRGPCGASSGISSRMRSYSASSRP
jgi:hypothetical protein